MTDLIQAAQQALDDLKDLHKNHNITCAGTIAALESALAQQAEPVAWVYTGIKQDGTEHGPHLVWKPEYMDAMSASKGAKATPLYTSPPQRPAEPVQEPVAKVELMTTGGNAGLATRIVEIDDHLRERLRPGQLLFTTPPQRKPLTDEKISDLWCEVSNTDFVTADTHVFARAIERAHGIGEQDAQV